MLWPAAALGVDSAFEPLPSKTKSSAVAAVHFAVRSRIFGYIEAFDRPGEELPVLGQALPEMIHSSNTVRAADLTTVRPYNPDLVNVVKDLEPLLPEAACRRLLYTGRILRDDAELKDE